MASIEDYGLIGDLHTAALVNRNGAIEWLCLPRFDSAACFAALLAGPKAGSWRLSPAGRTGPARRRYRGDSLVLETEWDTADGRVRLIDFMPPRGEAPDVVRIVEGVSGRVEMAMDLRLRMDYGHVVPWVRQMDGGIHAVAGPDAVWLDTPVPLHGRDRTTEARFAVAAGQRVPFVLTYAVSYRPRPRPVDAEQALDDTMAFWSDWLTDLDYRGAGNPRWSEAVRRSLLL